jgi:hypothetical protein
MLQLPHTTRSRNRCRAARAVLVLIAALSMALTMSCRDGHSAALEADQAVVSAAADDDAVESASPEPEYFHSPFALRLDGGRFDTIAFKDVGLKRVDGEVDALLLEVIAESLAYRLAAEERLGYTANLDYDEARANPANHLHCGLHHLYVDLWQGEDPARWGYSLWSGCSERDNFAHKELPRPDSGDDLAEYVEPLADSIVDSLVEASQSNCFQKQC